MDISKIKKLVELVSEKGLAELEVKQEGESVRIVLNRAPTSFNLPADGFFHSPPPISERPPAAAAEPKNEVAGYRINSPMVGTVYLSPSPNVENFVKPGQKVNAGDTLCLIEAMKTFNKIEADRNGVIAEILIENGQPVEYGQVLFVLS